MQVDGLVLARVGEHRLAFPAESVIVIERWVPGPLPVAHVRKLFALEPAPGRLILGETHALVVDALEIFRESATVAPVPGILRSALPKALLGFVTVTGELLPLLDVAALAQVILDGRPPS